MSRGKSIDGGKPVIRGRTGGGNEPKCLSAQQDPGAGAECLGVLSTVTSWASENVELQRAHECVENHP